MFAPSPCSDTDAMLTLSGLMSENMTDEQIDQVVEMAKSRAVDIPF